MESFKLLGFKYQGKINFQKTNKNEKITIKNIADLLISSNKKH